MFVKVRNADHIPEIHYRVQFYSIEFFLYYRVPSVFEYKNKSFFEYLDSK